MIAGSLTDIDKFGLMNKHQIHGRDSTALRNHLATTRSQGGRRQISIAQDFTTDYGALIKRPQIASNYQATISKNNAIEQVTENNFNQKEQTYAKQKLQMQETNLPGFSELKID